MARFDERRPDGILLPSQIESMIFVLGQQSSLYLSDKERATTITSPEVETNPTIKSNSTSNGIIAVHHHLQLLDSSQGQIVVLCEKKDWKRNTQNAKDNIILITETQSRHQRNETKETQSIYSQ